MTELLEQFGLSDAGGRPVKTYSGGMRRRLDLAASLVTAPPVLFLDEPTTGLDPQSRLALWDVIDALVESGTTVLLTTQYLEEADVLADRIVVLDRGAIIAEGTANELKARQGGDVVDVKPIDADNIPRIAELLSGIAGQPQIDARSGRVLVPVGDLRGVDVLTNVARAISDSGIELDDLAIHRPSLDDVFLALTGHSVESHVAKETEPTEPASGKTKRSRKGSNQAKAV